jgi:release factor glutamine methyltransferase
MAEASAQSLLNEHRPGKLGTFIGRLMALAYKISGLSRYDDWRIENINDIEIVVMPSVANPRLLRTGAFFASELENFDIPRGAKVLDLGTGSGVCALVAARSTPHVTGVDINPVAIRNSKANALLNGLDEETRFFQGDLFSPIDGQRFDLVLFNPPFLSGPPKSDRDAAWRSLDIPQRFARELGRHLTAEGCALVLLSSFGDACTEYEEELRAQGFVLDLFARRRYVNETVVILKVTIAGDTE